MDRSPYTYAGLQLISFSTDFLHVVAVSVNGVSKTGLDQPERAYEDAKALRKKLGAKRVMLNFGNQVFVYPDNNARTLKTWGTTKSRRGTLKLKAL